MCGQAVFPGLCALERVRQAIQISERIEWFVILGLRLGTGVSRRIFIIENFWSRAASDCRVRIINRARLDVNIRRMPPPRVFPIMVACPITVQVVEAGVEGVAHLTGLGLHGAQERGQCLEVVPL